MLMRYELIEIQKRKKGVTWIIIDNPPVNAIGEQLMKELEAAVDDLAEDHSVRVIVVTSNHPKIFLAGADLKGMIYDTGEMENNEDPIAVQSGKMQACFHKFYKVSKPVIAAINGHALGGGCELALACDFRMMSKGTIGLTETSLGIIPGAGGTQRMTHLIGRAKAMELIFTAKRLTPKEAHQIGLITQVAEDLEKDTTEFAEQLAEGAIHAMGLAKQAINGAEMPIEEGLKIEAKAFSHTFKTEEPGIGLMAFFQKEKAQFYSEG